jgi:hypothetical protein
MTSPPPLPPPGYVPTPPPDMAQDAIDMTYPPEPGDVLPPDPAPAPETATS